MLTLCSCTLEIRPLPLTLLQFLIRVHLQCSMAKSLSNSLAELGRLEHQAGTSPSFAATTNTGQCSHFSSLSGTSLAGPHWPKGGEGNALHFFRGGTRPDAAWASCGQLCHQCTGESLCTYSRQALARWAMSQLAQARLQSIPSEALACWRIFWLRPAPPTPNSDPVAGAIRQCS
jgi:hypothetical protein